MSSITETLVTEFEAIAERQGLKKGSLDWDYARQFFLLGANATMDWAVEMQRDQAKGVMVSSCRDVEVR